MKKKLIAPVVLSTALLAGSIPFSNVLAKQPEETATISLTNKWNEKMNVPIFVREKQLDKRNSSTASDALNYLEEKKSKVKIRNPKADLKVKKTNKDELGMTHVRFNQTKNGIPVEGAEVLVHYNEKNEIVAVNGTVNVDVDEQNFNTKPEVNSVVALASAKSSVDAPAQLQYDPTTELVVYPFEGESSLAYKVNVNFHGEEPGNWFVFVDAQSGKVIDKYNALMDADEIKTQTGTGTGVLGAHRLLHISQSKNPNTGTVFQLADYGHKNLGGIFTYDAPTGSLFTSNSASFKKDYDRAAVDAHYNSEKVYHYYLDEHGRNSLDDKGMAINSYVHYGTNYNNAFWDGQQMTYGDGDGSYMISLSAGLDVAAHEMTHGVTTNTANLQYRFQPGALNEAFSDIFGALIDDANWEIGEDIMGPGAKADGRESLRSLSDPSKYPVGAAYVPYGNGKGKYPAHMNEFYDLPRNLDNGGVHINSSIINHAAYTTAQEIGREKLGKIYYRALSVYLTPTSDFSAARKAIIQSAVDLYGAGSSEAAAAANGFNKVGILE
ncbi:M4 family metallopeptidase [Neobacillus novalis]|uniref:Neutral metalloproteinase n=1 Tax=Neobacillus novalis TaxID=220687 RepID=A0AA95MHZ2_9BACI|nr:M4 family metallopeptidase [Neobacillus novalis]WHY84112.1 M4 family metallopeptidase [Neobacillus novalis]